MSEQAHLTGMPNDILPFIVSHLFHCNAPLMVKQIHRKSPSNSLAITLFSKPFHTLISESHFTIDATPRNLDQHYSGYPLSYLESDVFKVGRRQIQHVEISSGKWLLFERFTRIRNQEWADASAKDVRILMSSLQNSAPQLEKISFATKCLDPYGASIIQDLALQTVWSFLPNVKEMSIVQRTDPIQDLRLEGPIRHTILLTYRENEGNGDWEKIFAH